jgi:hypothetical protein
MNRAMTTMYENNVNNRNARMCRRYNNPMCNPLKNRLPMTNIE